MRRKAGITDNAPEREYAEWLERHRSQGELAERVARIFIARGPALARRMRLDLGEFLRERSVRALACIVAMNDDPRDDHDFTAWADEGERT